MPARAAAACASSSGKIALRYCVPTSLPWRLSCVGSCVAKKTSSRSEEHTSELQSLMRISYAVFCLKKHNPNHRNAKRLQSNDIQKPATEHRKLHDSHQV